MEKQNHLVERKKLLTDISETYFRSLETVSFSDIPYHESIVLRAPINPGGVHSPLRGKHEVYEKWWKPLEPALEGLKAKIIGHFFDEKYSSILTRAEIFIKPAQATVRVADLLVIDDTGKITAQENHFDPSPIQIIGPTNTLDHAINAVSPGVHHITLRVADLAISKDFYKNTLGLNLILDNPDLMIFGVGRTFVGFKKAEPRDRKYLTFSPFEIGLDHLALGVESESELDKIAYKLNEANIENTGIKLDPVFNKKYIAFKDPDRISWEYYLIR